MKFFYFQFGILIASYESITLLSPPTNQWPTNLILTEIRRQMCVRDLTNVQRIETNYHRAMHWHLWSSDRNWNGMSRILIQPSRKCSIRKWICYGIIFQTLNTYALVDVWTEYADFVTCIVICTTCYILLYAGTYM